jgi:hypothetical protein
MEKEKTFSSQLTEMYEKDPKKLTIFLALSAGKLCVDASAGNMTINQDANYGDGRYSVNVEIKINKIE